MNLICKLREHRIDRHRVWHDGIDYRTNCARCAKPLLRLPSGWCEFDSEQHHHPQRQAHPHSDRVGT